jgi:hypothetical protein
MSAVESRHPGALAMRSPVLDAPHRRPFAAGGEAQPPDPAPRGTTPMSPRLGLALGCRGISFCRAAVHRLGACFFVLALQLA